MGITKSVLEVQVRWCDDTDEFHFIDLAQRVDLRESAQDFGLPRCKPKIRLL